MFPVNLYPTFGRLGCSRVGSENRLALLTRTLVVIFLDVGVAELRSRQVGILRTSRALVLLSMLRQFRSEHPQMITFVRQAHPLMSLHVPLRMTTCLLLLLVLMLMLIIVFNLPHLLRRK